MRRDELSPDEAREFDLATMSDARRALKTALRNTEHLAARLRRTIELAEAAPASGWTSINHAEHVADLIASVLRLDMHLNAMIERGFSSPSVTGLTPSSADCPAEPSRGGASSDAG